MNIDATRNLGKYQILSELGKGGFATVYRARDPDLGRDVALKVLDPLLTRDPMWVARFRREARAVASLDHPRVVTVHEIGQAEGSLYIAMKLVEGGSLKQRIDAQGALPWDEVVRLTGQIAEALDFAHGQGVLHRDLKPANVLLDTRLGAVLSDFGFASLVADNSLSISMSGGVVGTPAYIAPEVWEGDDPTPQTDFYALGCIVYELVSGQALFGGASTPAVMRAHFQPRKLPETWPEGTPPGLRDVLLAALAQEPAERYAAAGELSAALAGLRTDPLAEPYAQMQAAVEAGRWQEALALAGQVRAVDAGYRDVVALETAAKAGLRKEQLAAPYGQLQSAVEGGRWQEALALAEQVRAADAGYRDVVALEAAALVGLEQEARTQQAVEWRAEAERALADGDLKGAGMAMKKWQALAPDDPAASEFHERLTRAEPVAVVLTLGTGSPESKQYDQSAPVPSIRAIRANDGSGDNGEPPPAQPLPQSPLSRRSQGKLGLALASIGLVVVGIAAVWLLAGQQGIERSASLTPAAIAAPIETPSPSRAVVLETATPTQLPPSPTPTRTPTKTPTPTLTATPTVTPTPTHAWTEYRTSGHFDASAEAFRHWDAEEAVPGGCVKCHTKEGMPEFIVNNTNVQKPPSDSLDCITCHSDGEDYSTSAYQVTDVVFPSGATVTMDDTDSNLCISCHQGRASTASIDRAVANLEEDTVPDSALRFINVHYLSAGTTLFGGEVQGAYQYPDPAYLGQFAHVPGFNNCTNCHATHELEVKSNSCFTCHAGVETVDAIRGPLSTTDYDGDGDTTEGIAGEIQTYGEKLYAAIQDYAANVAGAPIVYDAAAYPYFFEDTDGNGERNGEEAAYAAWTPRLLKAAYNYQYIQKDPGAFAHNGKYVIQFVYDTLDSLSKRVTVDMTGMVRPEAPVQ